MAHISEKGWIEADNGFVGTMKKGNEFKIESIALKTSEKVEKDFLKISAFIYTYWGEGTYSKSQYTKMTYNYGNNPITGYKTMLDELVKIKDSKYIQIGGEGVNGMGLTDINGENPIPDIIAYQYKYGITSLKLDCKNHNENSIIYQIFFNDTGWSKTFKNGESAIKAIDKPIEAIKISVIPSSEIEYIIKNWDKNIGTYNLE